MTDLIIINAKCKPALKEAIRVVAFNQGHSNSSRTIVEILENDPRIRKALAGLKKSTKKVA